MHTSLVRWTLILPQRVVIVNNLRIYLTSLAEFGTLVRMTVQVRAHSIVRRADQKQGGGDVLALSLLGLHQGAGLFGSGELSQAGAKSLARRVLNVF